MENKIKELIEKRDVLSDEIVVLKKLLSDKVGEFQEIAYKLQKIKEILKD